MLPPRARIQPTRIEVHGVARFDNYYWLKQREDPEVLAYLQQENEYTRASMAHTLALQETLFEELRGRVAAASRSAGYERDGYAYFQRSLAGEDYPLDCRAPLDADPGQSEEVLLDANELAGEDGYCGLAGRSLSPDGRLYAFGLDDVGRGSYSLRVKQLSSGELLPDRIEGVTGNQVWASDSRTLFYSRQDARTLRPFQIWRHSLGSEPARDVLVYQEEDERFRCLVGKTRSQRFLLILSTRTNTSEVRYLEAESPTGEFRVVEPREAGHEYRVEHQGDFFYVRSNLRCPDFELMRAPLDAPGRASWEPVLAGRAGVLLEDVDAFAEHLVLSEREAGLLRLRVLPRSGTDAAARTIDFDEPAYRVDLAPEHDFDSRRLRWSSSSLTRPQAVYEQDLESGRRKRLWQQPIGGGFDPANYRAHRLWALARDGARVPISLVARVDAPRDGTSPLLLTAYGAYGASFEAGFDPDRLSLLDRGFVFAIAHVRGGSELGRAWYEAGRRLEKQHSFTDFIDCADYLVRAGYSAPDRLFGCGRSAGGLLIAAVANQRPELFRGLIAEVPFVDVLTTMLDPALPLTTAEYDEWGDPRRREDHDAILSWSPYDRVLPQSYPNLLVTAAYHDSRVPYWEAAKWVAKLRVGKRGHNRLLLETDMQAGHGGAAGRERRTRDTAFRYAFLLDLLPADARR